MQKQPVQEGDDESIGLDLIQQSEEEIAKTFYKEKRKDYVTEVQVGNQYTCL